MYICVVYVVCFFFKQKTAYEMRISDWSSDVCSSDLGHEGRDKIIAVVIARLHADRRLLPGAFARLGQQVRFQLIRQEIVGLALIEIGRASCRERVCQYV